MNNAAVAPGTILWLPDNVGTRAVITDHGALEHPVLVLSNPGVLAGNSQHGQANIQILIITSLGNTSLADKFPGQSQWAVARRREYLPLERSPPEPHPDSGVLLEVHITGNATVTRKYQSYVRLRVPLVVAHENLVGVVGGTVKLERGAFASVVDHLRRACPGVVVPLATEPPPVASPAPIEEIVEPESEVGEPERTLRTPVSALPASSHTDRYASAPALEAAGHNEDGSKSPLWRRVCCFCACAGVVGVGVSVGFVGVGVGVGVVVVAFVGTVAF